VNVERDRQRQHSVQDSVGCSSQCFVGVVRMPDLIVILPCICIHPRRPTGCRLAASVRPRTADYRALPRACRGKAWNRTRGIRGVTEEPRTRRWRRRRCRRRLGRRRWNVWARGSRGRARGAIGIGQARDRRLVAAGSRVRRVLCRLYVCPLRQNLVSFDIMQIRFICFYRKGGAQQTRSPYL
jgi:hypothetical protein